MKILIHLQSATQLLCHEAVALAFALASFDHEIQLWLDDNSLAVIQHSSKLSKMLASLELYDMPKAWISADYKAVSATDTTDIDTGTDTAWQSQLIAMPSDANLTNGFDLTLVL